MNVLESINCDPSIYRMDHTDFIVCSFRDNSIVLNRDNIFAVLLEASHGLNAFYFVPETRPRDYKTFFLLLN